jgi:hypothetical protein
VQLSAYLYRQAIFSLPALVRMWSTEIKDKNFATLIDKYTINHITPEILKREFELILNYKSKEPNFAIKANRMTNEVIAIYEKDEVKLTSTFLSFIASNVIRYPFFFDFDFDFFFVFQFTENTFYFRVYLY